MQNLINNHFLLRALAKEIEARAQGYYLYEAYSLNKKEAAFLFRLKDERLYLHVYLGEESFVFLPREARRGRGTMAIFEELENLQLDAVTSPENDRSLALHFGIHTLLIKLHGRNGNLILFKKDSPKEVFRESFARDKESLLWTYLQRAEEGKLPSSLPQSIAASVKNGELTMGAALAELAQPQYYLYKQEERAWLTFYPQEDADPFLQTESPIEAVNAYASAFFRIEKLLVRKRNLLSKLKARVESVRNSIRAAEKHLSELEKDKDYKGTADLIMANLHQWPENEEQFIAEDFYTGEPRVLKVKDGLSPQRTAEKLYRKSRNQEGERDRTIQKIIALEEESENLKTQLLAAENASKPDQLNSLETAAPLPRQQVSPLPYRTYKFGAYEVLVGKGARQNDELTFGVAQKEDLWLHAQGLSGSHVILRRKRNQEIPAEILEKAAELAAWHSKGRGAGLCPVTYTLKKYVRKPKGALPGAVIQEKEKSLMVEPLAHQEAISS